MKYLTLFVLFTFVFDSYAQMSIPSNSARKRRRVIRGTNSNSNSSTSGPSTNTPNTISTSGNSIDNSSDNDNSIFNDATQNLVNPASITDIESADECEDVSYAVKNYALCCSKGNYKKSKKRRNSCRRARRIVRARDSSTESDSTSSTTGTTESSEAKDETSTTGTSTTGTSTTGTSTTGTSTTGTSTTGTSTDDGETKVFKCPDGPIYQPPKITGFSSTRHFFTFGKVVGGTRPMRDGSYQYQCWYKQAPKRKAATHHLYWMKCKNKASVKGQYIKCIPF